MENQTRQSRQSGRSARRWMVLPWQPVTPWAASGRRDVWDELRQFERLLVADAALDDLREDIGRAAAEAGCVAETRDDGIYVSTTTHRAGRVVAEQLLFATTLVMVKGTYDGR